MRLRTLIDEITKSLVRKNFTENVENSIKEELTLHWSHVLLSEFQQWYVTKEVIENLATIKFCVHFGVSTSLLFE